MRLVATVVALAVVGAAGPAAAHVGAGAAAGFGQGLVHPPGGADHLLAMMAVGLVAAGIGGRALWAVPLSFLGAMALGGALGAHGVPLPHGETAAAASVLAFGSIAAARRALPVAAASAVAAAFALFHGQLHGSEMAAGTPGLPYGIGFLVSTAALHAVGLGLGRATLRPRRFAAGDALYRSAGAATALAGAALLVAAAA